MKLRGFFLSVACCMSLFFLAEQASARPRDLDSVLLDGSRVVPEIRQTIGSEDTQIALNLVGSCKVDVYVWDGSKWVYSHSYRCPAGVTCAECMAR